LKSNKNDHKKQQLISNAALDFDFVREHLKNQNIISKQKQKFSSIGRSDINPLIRALK
jgi:hypothetical protein